jgi:hypothetical protein
MADKLKAIDEELDEYDSGEETVEATAGEKKQQEDQK